jgi:hypothetical protein
MKKMRSLSGILLPDTSNCWSALRRLCSLCRYKLNVPCEQHRWMPTGGKNNPAAYLDQVESSRLLHRPLVVDDFFRPLIRRAKQFVAVGIEQPSLLPIFLNRYVEHT